VKARSPKNFGKGYRFIVQDRGSRQQLRWEVSLHRRGITIYATKCRHNVEEYFRAVKACLDFLYACREHKTYCAQTVHIAIARENRAKIAAWRAERSRALAKQQRGEV
jgi:hypothetical protein